MNFSRRVNRKQIATNSSPSRDQQFQHIGSLRTRLQRQGLPIISVDGKKRELIGNFKNAGAKWDRSPVLVNDHHFGSDGRGVGISYGIYDSPHNRAAPSASASRTTRRPSPPIPSPPGGNAKEPAGMAARPNFWFWPIPAAANSCTSWAWKTELQDQVCNPFGLAVTIARRQMESHRAPAIFRDLQELGGRASRQLRQDVQIHSHHQHSNRFGRDRIPGPKRVSHRPQTKRAVDLLALPQTRQDPAPMELYDCAQSVKLILRRR
jgi:hypothetical protein